MQGATLIKPAADLSMGSITADLIEEEYGAGVLSSVLQITGAGVAGSITNSILNKIDKETDLVSDLGSLVDDAFSIFD